MLAARRVSLASLSAAVLAPVVAWTLSYPEEVAWMSLVIGFLVVVRHRENIRRLMAGEEPRLELRRSGSGG